MRKVVREIIIFAVMIAAFTGGLLAVAQIPQDAIRGKMAASADYLCDEEMFHEVIPGVESSKWDHYADSILLGIAWQYDADKPIRSVMQSSFYSNPFEDENVNLRNAVAENLPANEQYLRYWHGSILWVRPLMLVLSLQQIYIFHAILLATLLAVLTVLLLKRRAYLFVAGLFVGLVATAVWFVPFTLEYCWNYLWMAAFSLIILHLEKKEKTEWYTTAFLIFGMITVFFDFLTTETLTLTVPLLLLLYLEGQKGRNEDTIRRTVGCSARWLIGYAGAWCAKWLLACVALSENVLPEVAKQVHVRLGRAEDFRAPIIKVLRYSVRDNFARLFPFDLGNVGKIVAFLLLMVYAYLLYVYRGEIRDKKRLLAYLAIGFVPILRFLVLRNHSYLHDFFTYRALLGTILAVTLIASEMNISFSHGREVSDG